MAGNNRREKNCLYIVTPPLSPEVSDSCRDKLVSEAQFYFNQICLGKKVDENSNRRKIVFIPGMGIDYSLSEEDGRPLISKDVCGEVYLEESTKRFENMADVSSILHLEGIRDRYAIQEKEMLVILGMLIIELEI